MLHRLKVLIRTAPVSLSILATLLGACTHHSEAALGAAKLSESANAFVPEDSSDRKVAPNIPWVQIDFTVRRNPFQFAFSDSILSQAIADGWAACRPKTSEWVAYEDQSIRPSQYIQSRKYGMYRRGILVILVGIYYSESEATSVKNHAGQSEMVPQHGVVIARNSTRDQALEWAASQDLSCEKLAAGSG